MGVLILPFLFILVKEKNEIIYLMKNLYLTIIIILFSLVNANSQNYSQYYTGHNAIFSLKAGYHTSPMHQFFGGFTFDFTGELHLGKKWYLGINYDYFYSVKKDEPQLYYLKNLSNSGISLILKYRYPYKNIFFNLGFGLGSSIMKFSYAYGNENEKYIHYNLRLGFDYLIRKNIMLSFETSYFAGSNWGFDDVFSKMNYQQFNFKAGLSYAFLQK